MKNTKKEMDEVEWMIKSGCEISYQQGEKHNPNWYKDLATLMFLIETGKDPLFDLKKQFTGDEFNKQYRKWVDTKQATEYLLVLDRAEQEIEGRFNGKKITDAETLGEVFYNIYQEHERGKLYFNENKIEKILNDIRRKELEQEQESWGKS